MKRIRFARRDDDVAALIVDNGSGDDSAENDESASDK